MDLVALGNVKHNGKWFNSGDSMKKVKKEDGERLVDMGVAKIDEVSEKLKVEEEAAKKKAEEQAKKDAEAKAKADAVANSENEKK
ncbi:DUF7210 family protein [Metabacillus bambusae]|uniref:DUF7210 domain-containing protein n=1 Tax=Metabacillus bambusae TaxID=2795218 RepID=A0ABS3NAN8_9BACI|nr:hypothetical protein [Metabacillus bambusae]MBO1515049.1 hypothetical protein [Metabacillus bambusae]